MTELETEKDSAQSGQHNSGPNVILAYLKTLPNQPGVYRMFDAKDDVLYVGKAKNLKKRVASYTKYQGHSVRIATMISATTRMEFITTGSEAEALLLESNLIKRLRPRYNVLLRDDKSFPFIHITGGHDFPQIRKHRGARKEKGDYFGPFASAGSVNRTLNILQKAFLLRNCTDSIYENRSRPCLQYQIKRCSAPCVDYISKEKYAALVEQAEDFLKGDSRHVQETLTTLMEKAAQDLDFETAVVYRDRIKALTMIQARQDINPDGVEEADVIAAYQDGGQTCIQVFFFRGSQNWGNYAFYPRADRSDTVEEILGAFIGQFYDNKPIPKQIYVSHEVPGQPLLAEAFSIRSERKIEIVQPKRGSKRDLVLHALTNAREALARKLSESSSQKKLLDGVAKAFGMESAPERIETYDNSHIQGAHAIGAMIVAGPDGFLKSHYRTFNIKNADLTPGDDFGMMKEVLSRRFTRLMKEDGDREKGHWPDLVLIDGGKGQLSAAHDVLENLGVDDVLLVGISKGPDRNAGREEFHIRGQKSFMLPLKDPVLYYLQRLRDEAHRFAIGTHRAKRSKAQTKSPLDGISGIGQKRKRALLLHFGSAKAVERASMADLARVDGISDATARVIYDYFHDSH